jgi:hypothetical protein
VAEKASCGVSGCVCQQRVPCYPSDMTDAEWAILAPEARAVMYVFGSPVTGVSASILGCCGG